MKETFKKILIVQTAFIGDVILATPLIEKLQKKYPNAQIDFLLRKGNEGLLTDHPQLNEVLIWYKKNAKYRSLFRLIRQVRKRKYDHLFNLQRFGAMGLLAAFSGAKEITGFDKNPFSRFFHRAVSHQFGTYENFIHEVDRNLSLIGHLTDIERVRPKLCPSENDFEAVKMSEPYVCIAPTSVWFTKQWPAKKWVELIEKLPRDLTVFLLGGPGDFDACEAIRTATSHPKVVNQSGHYTFLQSVALMQGARMNYVNDSAPLHMASSVNAPVTAIFCSTVPRFGFTPLSDRSFILQNERNLPCRPCGLHGKSACPEGHFRCAEVESSSEHHSQRKALTT